MQSIVTSFNSNSDISDIFKRMFPESMIAQKFKLGETKTKYYLDHGLKPHFLDLVWKKVDSNSVCKWFVICYDETLNDKLQAKQLDMHTRFWDGKHVVTSYKYSEVFEGSAEDARSPPRYRDVAF